MSSPKSFLILYSFGTFFSGTFLFDIESVFSRGQHASETDLHLPGTRELPWLLEVDICLEAGWHYMQGELGGLIKMSLL